MGDKDADLLLERLKAQKKNGEALSRTDCVGLAMTPVMGSRRSNTERIIKAMNLVKSEPGEDAQRVMAVLYAFAEKFMENEANLEKLREVMRMTRLGQMLFDEGLEQGLEQGMERGLEQGLAQGLGLVNRLNEKLIADGRMEEKIKRVLSVRRTKLGCAANLFMILVIPASRRGFL